MGNTRNIQAQNELVRKIRKLEKIKNRSCEESDELIKCRRELLRLRNDEEPLHQGAIMCDVHDIFRSFRGNRDKSLILTGHKL